MRNRFIIAGILSVAITALSISYVLSDDTSLAVASEQYENCYAEKQNDSAAFPAPRTLSYVSAGKTYTATAQPVKEEVKKPAEKIEAQEVPVEEKEEEKEPEVVRITLDAVPLPSDLQVYLQEVCEQYGVPYTLALAVIETETGFRPGLSVANCHGYMMIHGINRSWLNKELGVTNLLDPKQNLQSGVYILSGFYEKYKDWSKALVCYNCGEYGAKSGYFSKGYTSSSYSRKVLSRKEKWDAVVYPEEVA